MGKTTQEGERPFLRWIFEIQDTSTFLKAKICFRVVNTSSHYEKCFTMFVAHVKLVNFTLLNLATWQQTRGLACLKPATRYTKNEYFFCTFQKPLLPTFENTFWFKGGKKMSWNLVQTLPSSSFYCKKNS